MSDALAVWVFSSVVVLVGGALGYLRVLWGRRVEEGRLVLEPSPSPPEPEHHAHVGKMTGQGLYDYISREFIAAPEEAKALARRPPPAVERPTPCRVQRLQDLLAELDPHVPCAVKGCHDDRGHWVSLSPQVRRPVCFKHLQRWEASGLCASAKTHEEKAAAFLRWSRAVSSGRLQGGGTHLDGEREDPGQAAPRPSD